MCLPYSRDRRILCITAADGSRVTEGRPWQCVSGLAAVVALPALLLLLSVQGLPADSRTTATTAEKEKLGLTPDLTVQFVRGIRYDYDTHAHIRKEFKESLLLRSDLR